MRDCSLYHLLSCSAVLPYVPPFPVDHAARDGRPEKGFLHCWERVFRHIRSGVLAYGMSRLAIPAVPGRSK